MSMNTNKPAQCTFGELDDGEHFHLTISNIVWQRVSESDMYNAVAVHNSNRSMHIPNDAQVVRVSDTSTIKTKAEDDTISSNSFTMVMLPTSGYAFKDKILNGSEWMDIHSSNGWACTRLSTEGIYMCINELGQYCFVFSDEAEQFSQPYPTVQDAKNARTSYAQNLISEACALADEMNDNMRKYGTIDKPAKL